MDGGLDSERFGWDLQERLQKLITARPMRELLVGEALVIPTNDPKVPYLISAPTMRMPMVIKGTKNAYLAMKALLSAVLSFDGKPPIRSIAIPGLGIGIGKLGSNIAAMQMHDAFMEVFFNTSRI